MEVDLLRDLLKQVSRSFYLSLAVLPKSLRRPIGFAYLFARAADTIADTRLIRRETRIIHLEALRAELDASILGRLDEIARAAAGPQQLPAERTLLDRLPDLFTAYRALEPQDRERLRKLLMTITEGMMEDLRRFPGEDEGKLTVFETSEELDRYTYLVAGCVGEFWTEMHLAHRPRLNGLEIRTMTERGIRFGKGLQMTNVLRDLSRDLRIGRCYLPRQELAKIGLSPEELLEPANVRRLKPLLHDLIRLTLDHYQAGWAYTLAIPRREWRTRLACAWPLLIGLKTLTRIAGAENLLDPSVTIKISRQSVYALLLRSGLVVASNRGLTAMYQRLFGRCQRALLAKSP